MPIVLMKLGIGADDSSVSTLTPTASARVQSQGVEQQPALDLAREAVLASASPPRRVDWFRCSFVMYSLDAAPRLLAWTAIWVVTLVGSYLYVDGDGAAIAFVRIVLLLGGLLGTTISTTAGLMIAWRTRRGLAGTSEVVSSTIGPNRYGVIEANGTRVVHHPTLGDFHDRFSIGAPWATAVVPGASLEVLVDPEEPRTLLTLGMQRDGWPEQ